MMLRLLGLAPVVLAFLTVLAQRPTAADDATRKPTAAFIDFDRSPVGAILEAELLQSQRVTWIERPQIDKVLQEQKLQALFAPEGGKQRVKLGALLYRTIHAILLEKVLLASSCLHFKTPVVS